ncbi:MAG: methionine adenosyltransferase [Acidimicrobiales bacterium]|jgi:S-adenosylmethionine synthetase|nr:methionine adenosyltransferase [Acidimicrobiales bacterium]
MATTLTLRTSESVRRGHPDKVADQISDAVLDAILAEDRDARVACETVVGRGFALVTGEITTDAYVDIPTIARTVIADIGYTDPRLHFAADSVAVFTTISPQSGDIARGVDTGGAGDQGIVWGHAVDHSTDLLPAPIALAHALVATIDTAARAGTLPGLHGRPDGKAQATLRYDTTGRPVSVDTVVVSVQHRDDADPEALRHDVRQIIDRVVAGAGYDPNQIRTIHLNPTGRFVEGGPAADVGLTGRKPIVDTYGGAIPHGGGAFSGKDPSKVDRSAAYAARAAAKAVVAADLSPTCTTSLAYAIGVAEPVAITLDLGDTTLHPGLLARLDTTLRDLFGGFTPRGIIDALHLRNPDRVRYLDTATYGHLGVPAGAWTTRSLPWEDVEVWADHLRALH